MKIPRGLLPGVWTGLILILILSGVDLRCQTGAPINGRQPGAPSQSLDDISTQAQHALETGNYAEAIRLYERLIKSAPNSPEIHSNLAVAYYLSGRFPDAARESRTALKLKPSLLNAHYFLGISLAQSGYCREALPYLEKDFHRVKDSQLKRMVGTNALRCSMDLNDVDKALNYDRKLTREFPDDAEILYLTTHMFSDLSSQASQHLLASSPGSYQVQRMNAEVLELQGKPQEAITDYRKVLKMDPHVPGIHYEIGRIMLQQSHDIATLDKARKEFEAELQIDPGNAQAEYQLGEIASTLRDWGGAISHLQKAVKLDPQMVPALVALGKAYASAGRAKDAVTPLKRATELDPNNVDAHYRLSFVYRRLGRDREADQEMAAYKKAYELLLKFRQRVRTGVVGSTAGSVRGTADH